VESLLETEAEEVGDSIPTGRRSTRGKLQSAAKGVRLKKMREEIEKKQALLKSWEEKMMSMVDNSKEQMASKEKEHVAEKLAKTETVQTCMKRKRMEVAVKTHVEKRKSLSTPVSSECLLRNAKSSMQKSLYMMLEFMPCFEVKSILMIFQE
jgi:hypothetical protein